LYTGLALAKVKFSGNSLGLRPDIFAPASNRQGYRQWPVVWPNPLRQEGLLLFFYVFNPFGCGKPGKGPFGPDKRI